MFPKFIYFSDVCNWKICKLYPKQVLICFTINSDEAKLLHHGFYRSFLQIRNIENNIPIISLETVGQMSPNVSATKLQTSQSEILYNDN